MKERSTSDHLKHDGGIRPYYLLESDTAPCLRGNSLQRELESVT